MKKLFSLKCLGLALFVGLVMTSCASKTTTTTSTSRQVAGTVITATFADLKVSPKKVTHKYYPTKEITRGGSDNVVNSAIQDALEKNGGGDVLVEKQVTMSYDGGVIDYVIVSGYPATYTNFRPASDEALKTKLINQSLTDGQKAPGKGGFFK